MKLKNANKNNKKYHQDIMTPKKRFNSPKSAMKIGGIREIRTIFECETSEEGSNMSICSEDEEENDEIERNNFFPLKTTPKEKKIL